DEVISMAVLRRMEATPAERVAYLKQASALRRATGETEEDAGPEVVEADEEAVDGEAILTTERLAEMGAGEQFILTVADTGLGKRSSAYEYRRTGRGGQGLDRKSTRLNSSHVKT